MATAALTPPADTTALHVEILAHPDYRRLSSATRFHFERRCVLGGAWDDDAFDVDRVEWCRQVWLFLHGGGKNKT